jgi:hypothetical protein
MTERAKKPNPPKRRPPLPTFGNPNEPLVDGPEPDPDAPTRPEDGELDELEIEEIDDQTDDGDE